MKQEYIICRTIGHAWDQIPTKRRPPWGALLTFRCTRCTMIREDIIDSNFALSSRRYDQPEGYNCQKMTRTEWRSLMVAKTGGMVKHAEA